LNDIIDYIDWSSFFYSWELTGRCPDIFNHPVKGKIAKELYQDALRIIEDIINKNLLYLDAIVGIYRANSDGDDILIDLGERGQHRLVFMRNQNANEDMNYCLSDFIAPIDMGIDDYIGMFVLTVGGNIEIC
jgi:5-methyltetrahydrofolate--homocysteine methyltransferase